jgi:deoxyadenosine/deoxycytidine kinase
VIYLQAQPETLIDRIQRRGLSMESGITAQYLRALADGYSQFFHHYEASPLLIVNTERLNPIEREEDFALLVRQLAEMRGRRAFFNRGD